MYIEKLPYTEIHHFQKLFQDYVRFSPDLRPFIASFPTHEAIAQQVEQKKNQFTRSDRSRLHGVISEQYKQIELTKKQAQHLESLLSPNTFSISCGHQLNIAGGPWYILYKLLSIAVYADYLNALYPDLHFVPVFWLAGEDHDLEEISVFQFFGKSYTFDLQAEGAAGQVATERVVTQLSEIPDMPDVMKEAYERSANLADATRLWIQKILGEKGILCLDASDRRLKEMFLPLAWKELEQADSIKLIDQCTAKLEKRGYKPQIHAREINLFFLDKGYRCRIEKEADQIRTTDKKFSWSLADAKEYFAQHPEKLSPNVALRPLYSQLILPDVAFIGGPAEISYWLQLKDLFDAKKLPFPILIPRFSGMYVNESQVKKLKKLGLKAKDLFQEIHQLKKDKIIPNYQLPALAECYSDLLKATATVDPTLVPAFEAELAKLEKQIENLEKRLKKAAEQKNDLVLQQITGLQQRLFPNGSLQERQESWLAAMVNNPGLVDLVEKAIEPFNFQMVIFAEGKSADSLG